MISHPVSFDSATIICSDRSASTFETPYVTHITVLYAANDMGYVMEQLYPTELLTCSLTHC